MRIIAKPFVIVSACLLASFTPAAVTAAEAPSLALHVSNIPGDGLVLAQTSLQGLRKGLTGVEPSRIQAQVSEGGKVIPSQWIPGIDYDGKSDFGGTLLLSFPNRKSADLRLTASAKGSPLRALQGAQWFKNSESALKFDVAAAGIFPAALQFDGAAAPMSNLEWNTRICNREDGCYFLRYDKNPRLEIISDGAVATVLRGRAKYCSPSGQPAPGTPGAVIDWYVFKQHPLTYVSIKQSAEALLSTHYWSEDHLLELNFKGDSFKNFSGDAHPEPVQLLGKGADWSYQRWGALSDGVNTVAMLGAKGYAYDGGSDYGSYLQLMEPGGWEDWGGETQKAASWLRFTNKPVSANSLEAANSARLVHSDIRTEVGGATAEALKLRASAAKLAATAREGAIWRIGVQEGLLNKGWLTLAELKSDSSNPALKFVRSGKLGLAFFVQTDGLQLVSIYDFLAHEELLSRQNQPLLQVMLRKNRAEQNSWIDSQSGWQSCRFNVTPQGFMIEMSRLLSPGQTLKAVITATRDEANSAWTWNLQLGNHTREWSIDKVTFPQAALANWGPGTKLFLPYAAGWVRDDLFTTAWEFKGDYPSNAAMQYMAAYREGAKKTGLYFGRYDGSASSKDIYASSVPSLKQLVLNYSQTAENATVPGNTFTYQGTSYWRLLHGDWFDAAKIYRGWVKNHAPWWPVMTPEGRADTPAWAKKIDLWINAGGENKIAQANMEKVQKMVDEPVGAHWYAWPQIPFDNDYPHYFPAKEGFKEAVTALQKEKVFVMPYINARLWDTRDRGIEDWEYTTKALPWTTKLLGGGGSLKVQTEESFPKESDGKTVSFGVMCPYTKFWQDTIADLSDKLANDVGVKGIYLDQIAAAGPVVCMDPSHGHPLGGGHWWVDGYNEMLKKVRARIPKGVILTSECNAEPYMKYFDGYLVWHWQYSGMVPAYPAVYAGAVQMFGRNYAYTGADIDPGMRMKGAQSLVFGEQMGWMPADLLLTIANDKTRSYYVDLIKTRQRFQKYLYAGEMARPPQISSAVPTMTADWQWSGQKTTLPTIFAGAWKLSQGQRAILIFSNASEAPVSMPFTLQPGQYGIGAKAYTVKQTVGATMAGAAKTVSGDQVLTLKIPGLSTLVVELSNTLTAGK